MRYQFTGTQTEVFPTILTVAGTLVCEPGDTVELATPVDHPRLVEAEGTGPATHTADVVADVAEHVAKVAASKGKRAAGAVVSTKSITEV